MRIRCENCHTEFQYEPPVAGDIPLIVPCTECEFPNSVPGGGSRVETGETLYTQCFSCGRQMIHDASLAIPICKNCQEGEEQASSLKEWMVKKLSGQIYGPFDAETIQTWIQTHKIEGRDEVAKVGGQWKKFDAHPAFSRLFPSAASANAAPATPSPVAHVVKAAVAQVTQTKAGPGYKPLTEKKPKKQIDYKYYAQSAAAVVGTVIAAAGSWYLLQSEALVVPEPWVDSLKAGVQTQVIERLTKETVKETPAQVAFRDVLERLQKEHPEVNGPSTAYFIKGRAAFLLNTDSSIRRARTLLERAVVVDPHNDLALAALAELYGTTSETALQQDALKLVDEADRLNRSSAEVQRAKAAIAVSVKRPEDARTHAAGTLSLNPADPDAAYYVGRSYMVATPPNYEEALKHFQKSIELDSQFHKSYHELGVVFLRLNQFNKAADALQRTLKMDPRDERALTDYARLLEEVGDSAAALGVLEQALRSSNEDIPQTRLLYAVLLYQARGDVRQAISVLTDLTPVGESPRLSLPDHKEALAHLAAAQRISGSPQSALETLKRLFEIDENYGPGLFQRGLALMALGQLDEAGKSLRTAASVVNGKEVEAEIKYSLSQILRAQGKTKDAVGELEDAISDFKYQPRYYLALAQIYVELGQFDEALNIVRDGGKQDPVYVSRRSRHPLYYHRPPSLSSAIGSFQKVLEQKDYLAEPWLGIGMVHWTLGNAGGASQAFQKAAEANERNPLPFLQLGLLALDQGNAAGAVTQLTRALENDSQLGVAHIYLGRAQLQLGQVSAAEATFERAQRYDRTNPVLLEGMGLVAVKKGELEVARKHFAKAIEQDSRFVPPRRDLYRLIP